MTKLAKVFTIASLLFLGAGVKYILETKHGSMGHAGNPKPISPPLTPPEAAVAAAETVNMGDVLWRDPEVSPKGENWTFDLFTAPTISREGGDFVAALPWLKKSQAMVDFEVVSVERKLYPLRLSGYFAEPTVDGIPSAEKGYRFMLCDTTTGDSLAVKLGQTLEKYGVEVRTFEEKSAADEGQSCPRLTVFDRRVEREITLTSVLQYDDGLWHIELRLKADGKAIFLSRTGENFSVGSECYTLERIDWDQKLLTFSQKVGKSAQNFSLPIGEPPANGPKNAPPKP
jgi:hypothetical protein